MFVGVRLMGWTNNLNFEVVEGIFLSWADLIGLVCGVAGNSITDRSSLQSQNFEVPANQFPVHASEYQNN